MQPITARPEPGRPAEPVQPGHDCPLCPRLAAFRAANRSAFPHFFNGPVLSFGPVAARLLLVGLAPGLRGANATGRPFTGDYAGELLYGTLAKYGFSRGTFKARPDDGLELIDCRITNAVRCVPPENKPVGAEIATCNRFLGAELDALPNVLVIIALGQIAHKAVVSALRLRQSSYPFAHGALHMMPEGKVLADSYHCSRYNTNTGRLTTGMFEAVFAAVRATLDAAAASAQAARSERS